MRESDSLSEESLVHISVSLGAAHYVVLDDGVEALVTKFRGSRRSDVGLDSRDEHGPGSLTDAGEQKNEISLFSFFFELLSCRVLSKLS
jgi:hypothetical protein